METEGLNILGRDVKDRKRLACKRAADMRYVGQEHPVTVELPPSLFLHPDRAALKRHFDDEHMKRYEFNAPKERAEIVSLHTSVIGMLDKPVTKPLPVATPIRSYTLALSLRRDKRLPGRR
jgi:N-methylhydantoinase A